MSLITLALAAAVAVQAAAAAQPIPLGPPVPVTVLPAQPAATIAPAPRPAVILSAPTESVLRAGTEVPLVMAESLEVLLAYLMSQLNHYGIATDDMQDFRTRLSNAQAMVAQI